MKTIVFPKLNYLNSDLTYPFINLNEIATKSSKIIITYDIITCSYILNNGTAELNELETMSILTLVAVIISLQLIFPSQSYAYLDPGSGSIILQLLLAAFFSALAVIKVFWGRIKHNAR